MTIMVIDIVVIIMVGIAFSVAVMKAPTSSKEFSVHGARSRLRVAVVVGRVLGGRSCVAGPEGRARCLVTYGLPVRMGARRWAGGGLDGRA